MSFMRFLVICCFFYSCFWAHAQGPISGFMPRKGHLDLAFSYSYDSYDTYLFGKQERYLDNSSQSVSLFAEYGISDSFSIVATLPYMRNDEINKGLQDINIFIKYRNQRKRHSLGSLSLITAVGLSFPVSGYATDTENPIGERATVFQGRFLAQYDFNYGFFLHLQTGINFRIVPDAQSSLPILFRFGFGSRIIYADFWLEILRTFSSGMASQVLDGAGSNWLKSGATIYISILPSIGLFVSGSRIFSGKNIGLSDRINTGFVVKF